MKIIYFLVLVLLFIGAFGITMRIEPRSEECFTETLDLGEAIEVRWSVQNGGLLDIETLVKTFDKISFNKMYYEGKQEGYHKIVPTAPGPYSFCFNNRISRYTSKTVKFNFVHLYKNENTPDTGHAKTSRFFILNFYLPKR